MEDELIDTSFLLAKRMSEDKKVHRFVRRQCRPDCVFKHVLCGNKCIGDDQSQLQDKRLLAIAENNDPFEIVSSDLFYSLNKKGRWNIIDSLQARIDAFQDDSENIRVSYMKSIIRDFGWKFKDEQWQENNRRLNVEFHTVENGTEIHKLAKKANKYDLVRKPQPSKKAKKGCTVRDEFSEPECTNMSFPKIHILYETATTVWDSRIRNKCDKKLAQVKRQQRQHVISKRNKINFDATESCLVDLIEMEEIRDFDCDYERDDNDNVMRPILKQPLEIGSCISANNYVKVNSKKKKKKNRNDENYERWLHNPSHMEFVDEDKVVTQLVGMPSMEEADIWHWKQMTASWEAELLPYMDIFVPEGKTLEEFVSEICNHYRKVGEIFPEHYISESVKDRGIKAMANRRNAYFIFQEIQCEEDEKISGIKIRCSVNAKTGVADQRSIFRTTNIYQSGLWNSAHLCPPEAFAIVEYLNKNWTIPKSLQEYVNPEKQCKAIEQHANNDGTLCGVCFAVTDGFALRCGHFFCKYCWIIHSRKSLLNRDVPIYCMGNNCSTVLDLEHIITFLPFSLCKKYETLLLERLTLSDDYMQCRKCERIIRFFTTASLNPRSNLAICKCQYVWCLKCRQRAHNPVPCIFATYYNGYLNQIGERDDNQLPRVTIFVKKCPQCGIYYNRFEGCPNMKCPFCGALFCDLCGTKLGNHYSDHGCRKQAEIQVTLFDVVAGKYAKLQEAFEKTLWPYRKERKPPGRRQFKKKLQAVGIHYNSSFNIYFAALETLELCKAYLLFGAWCSPKSTAQIPQNHTFHRAEIKYLYDKLQFTVERFQHALDKEEKSKISEWLNEIQDCVRKIMSVGYQLCPK